MTPLALVTGGSRRVGAAIALALAEAGMDLVITYRQDREGADAVCRRIAALGRSARAVELDLAMVTSPDAVAATLSLDRLDALVLNAAAWHGQPWSSWTHHDLVGTLQVNAVAPLLVAQSVRSLLERSSLPGGGSIVAIGDAHAAGTPVRGYAGYLMSKAALAQAVQQMAVELAPRIRANSVLPGVVAWPESIDEASRARILDRVPLGRAGEPQDVARLVRFLCLEAPFITGAAIPVDGGRSLR
jgi:pteridine reductase